MWPKAEAGNFTALVYSVLLSVGRSVLKMTDTLWKNSLIIAKDLRKVRINFIVIANIFSEKKLEVLLLYRLSYI
jgi:hypothetical protein